MMIFFYYLYHSIENENQKSYECTAVYYTQTYEKIKYLIPHNQSNNAKKFFEKKISTMKFNIGYEYLKNGDFSQANYSFKESKNKSYCNLSSANKFIVDLIN